MLQLPDKPKLLLIRRDNIGDLVLATPALALLRRRYPDAHIAALVTSYNADVLAGNPDLDELFVYTKTKHAGMTAMAAAFGKLAMLCRIRARRFDLAIVATAAPSPSWLALARQCGARRILAAVPSGSPAPRNIDMCVPVGDEFAGRHGAEHNVMLLEPLGVSGVPPAPRVFPDRAGVARAKALIDSSVPTKVTIGLHVSARKRRQRWPADRYSELAHRLHHSADARFALFWSPGDDDDPRHPGDDRKAAEVAAACRDIPLVPIATQSLRELIDGLAATDIVFCSDGGAMHVAAGLGKPIVALFGDSDPVIWRPWGVPHRVLRVSDDAADVTVEQAVAAMLELLPGVSRPANG